MTLGLELVRRHQIKIRLWLEGFDSPIPVLRLGQAELPKDFTNRLRAAFDHKCVYCEQPITQNAAANLSLFRPPFNAAQAEYDTRVPDYYAWLRWDARNIYLACAGCTSAKQNRFPIQGRRAARGTFDEALGAEKPLLLDPLDVEVNPLQHLSFDFQTGEVRPALIDKQPSAKGEQTIAVLDLNRAELKLARRQAAAALWSRLDLILKADEPERKYLLAAEIPYLYEICADKAPFAGLSRQLLLRWSQAKGIPTSNDWRKLKREIGEWNGVSAESSAPKLQKPTSAPVTDVLLVTVTEVEARALLEQCYKIVGKLPIRHFIENKTYHELGRIGGAQVCVIG